MKIRKKTRNIVTVIAIAAILVFGCTSEDMAADNPGEKKENAVIVDAENVADLLEAAGDSTIGEGDESGGSAAGGTENTEFMYDMDGNFIVNYNEVFAENEIFGDQHPVLDVPLEVPDCIIREEDIVGEFCEGFPEVLQQYLIFNNDSIHSISPEEAAILRSYNADYEKISYDGSSGLPIDQLLDQLEQLGVDTGWSCLEAVDIDSDGEDEYIFFGGVIGVGDVYYRQVTVLEYDDEYGWNIIGHGTAPYSAAFACILDYEGTKYILLGKLLVCWNDEYDGTTSDDEKPWNVMAANRELAGYTLNEIYSREGDHTDYLTGIDLENPRNNAERDYLEGAYYLTAWDCGEWIMRLNCDWEREFDGKTYLYVASDFRSGSWPQYDLLITVFEEGEDCMEAVKVYYFAAHYRLSLDIEECDIDGSW